MSSREGGGEAGQGARTKTSLSYKVPALPFSGKEEEWTAWKLRFGSWMKIIGVYDVMSGDQEKPAASQLDALQDYNRANGVAYTYIITNVKDVAFNTAAQAPEDDGKAAWTLLLNRYETKTRAHKITLLSDLMRVNLQATQDPEELFTKINDITKQLSYWENLRQIDDDWLIGITINALPVDAYGDLITVLENLDELTFEETKNRIRSYRNRSLERFAREYGTNTALYASSKIKCFSCGKQGHKSNKCPENSGKFCTKCKVKGHTDVECWNEKQRNKTTNGKGNTAIGL